MSLSIFRQMLIVFLTLIALVTTVCLVGWAACPAGGRPAGQCPNILGNPVPAGSLVLNSQAQESGCNGFGWFWVGVAGGAGSCWTNRPADTCVANAGTCCVPNTFPDSTCCCKPPVLVNNVWTCNPPFNAGLISVDGQQNHKITFVGGGGGGGGN